MGQMLIWHVAIGAEEGIRSVLTAYALVSFFFFFQSSKNLNSKLNSRCQDQKEREMPHKLDCAKFYPSHYSCPFQFHFDTIRLSDAQNLMVITSIQLRSTQYNSASVSKEVQFRNGIKCMKSLK